MFFCLFVTVKELVVSAGESVEVTLPRNGIELNAFVVPTPPPGKIVEALDKIPQSVDITWKYWFNAFNQYVHVH